MNSSGGLLPPTAPKAAKPPLPWLLNAPKPPPEAAPANPPVEETAAKPPPVEAAPPNPPTGEASPENPLPVDATEPPPVDAMPAKPPPVDAMPAKPPPAAALEKPLLELLPANPPKPLGVAKPVPGKPLPSCLDCPKVPRTDPRTCWPDPICAGSPNALGVGAGAAPPTLKPLENAPEFVDWAVADDWGLGKVKDAGRNNSPLETENVNVELDELVATLLNEPPNGFGLGMDALGIELVPNPPRLPKFSSVVLLVSGASSSISSSYEIPTSMPPFFPLGTLAEARKEVESCMDASEGCSD